jgi:glucose/arabinose dehydrogenase
MTLTSFLGLSKNGLTVGAGSLFVAASCLGQNHVLQGQGKAGDWQSDAPGVEHRISISDLPPDYATPSAYNMPKVVAPPKGAKPSVPKGFDVALFASGFANPRYLLTAPNGDIFVTESSANTIRVLRDSDADGHPEINEKFATGLAQPFGLAFYPGAGPSISLCCQYGRHLALSLSQWRSPGAW